MTDDQPTRDLGDPDPDDGAQPTVELRRRRPAADQTWVAGDDLGPGRDETQRIPDDLVPGLGHPRDPGRPADLADTQPIGIGDRWSRRRRPEPPPPAPRRERARRATWEQPDPVPAWRQAERPLPPAGRAPGPGPGPGPGAGPGPAAGPAAGPAPARRRGQSLLFWVFTLLVALGLGAAAVLGPWAEPLGLSPQATTLGVIVASLVAWILLSAVLRLVGILGVVLPPLLYLAGSVPELRRLPVDLPRLGGTATLLLMALGVASWLTGHWYFYARKGWWRSRVAGAVLGSIPGLEPRPGRSGPPQGGGAERFGR